MREKKQKNIKNLRLKKNKIESIAIKQSITNTGRYRNKPASVKFIFEDEVNENEMKEEYKIRKNHKKCST